MPGAGWRLHGAEGQETVHRTLCEGQAYSRASDIMVFSDSLVRTWTQSGHSGHHRAAVGEDTLPSTLGTEAGPL